MESLNPRLIPTDTIDTRRTFHQLIEYSRVTRKWGAGSSKPLQTMLSEDLPTTSETIGETTSDLSEKNFGRLPMGISGR